MIKLIKIKFDEEVIVTEEDSIEYDIYYGADGAEIIEIRKNGKQLKFHVETE